MYKDKFKISIFILLVLVLAANSVYGSELFKKKEKPAESLTTSDYIYPTPWAKPLQQGTIEILTIAPRYCSNDFTELKKRLDCNAQLITGEDATHLGCDPLWGFWCKEEEKDGYIIQKIKKQLDKHWDLLIIAGIDLGILPDDIYKKIITKISEGRGLILIPATTETPLASPPIIEIIDNLEPDSDPTERWLQLFSVDNPEMKTYAQNIPIRCVNYEKGRMVYIKNYLNGVENHALLPEKAVVGEMAYLENAWAGIISLMLWATKITDNSKILNVTDAKPPGPVEEEIPPELPIAIVQNLNQSLLGTGIYPIYIEIRRNGKQKIDHIKIQIRREKDYFHFQQYQFKPSIQKKGDALVQVEIPIGAGNYFLDVWLTQKEKVIDYFTKRFTFSSWPEIVSVEANKKSVFPNDSISLKINVLSSILENREGTIVVQGIDNYSSSLSPEGNLICEQTKTVKGKESEVSVVLNFADLMGNYLKINVWGAPMKINTLGTNYPTLFSCHTLFIPIQRKILEKEWKNFVYLPGIKEYNQLQTAKIFEQNFNSGIYLPIEQFNEATQTRFSQPFIVQMAEETTKIANSDNQRKPCINDENYINTVKDNLTKINETSVIPSPFAISLGMNNCLVQSDELVCYCDKCINKFMEIAQLSGFLQNTQDFNHNFVMNDPDTIRQSLLSHNFPVFLTYYQKFMADSFINFETILKNKLKLTFPETPIGFRIYHGNEAIRGIDWLTAINSMDWLVFDPEPMPFTLIPYIKSKNKSFWISLDFTNPNQSPEVLEWYYWKAILNQANGVWFLSPLGNAMNSVPIKIINENNSITQPFSNFYKTNKILQQGYGNLLFQSKPDYDEKVGIYYSVENLFLSSVFPEYSYKNSLINFVRILNGSGINPVILTKESLLSSKNLKVVILPCCLWLSEEEVEIFTEFLKTGVIIADISPGIIGDDVMIEKAIDINERLNDLGILVEKLLNDKETSTISNNKSEILDKSNIFIYGESMAKNIETEPLNSVKRKIIFVQKILYDNEIKSPFLKEGDWIDGQFFSFNNRKLIAWLPNINPVYINKEITLNPSIFQKKQVRELLTEKNIRNIKKIKLNIKQENPTLLSCSPKISSKVELTLPKIVNAGNRLPIKLQITGKENEEVEYWVYLELKLEQNEQKPLFSQLINIKQNESKEVFISIPLNQVLGWYVVSVHELISGLRTSEFVKIEM